VITTASTGTDSYLTAIGDLESRMNGRAPLHALRSAARERFEDLGFPTTRNEEWKYTNATPIARTKFALAAGPADSDLARSAFEAARVRLFGEMDSPLLVFVNGHYSEPLSTPGSPEAGFTVGGLSAALERDPSFIEARIGRLATSDDQGFSALNTALFQDGAFIHVARGRVIEAPVRILYLSLALSEPTMSHPRTLIVADEHSQLTVVESYAVFGDGPCFTNAVTEVFVDDAAVVDHYKIQQDQASSYHIASLLIRQGQSTNFSSHSVGMGGAIVRNGVRALLDGEGSESHLNGLYLAGGHQHVDNHTAIDHARPNCNSREIYHGILDGSSTGVFNGKIFVRQDAQKTDARQTNRNLLLSNSAVIDTKPQLEIFADDVKCTHGATVGQLDEEAIFYLRTRGIPRAEAASLLTYAFASEIVDRVRPKAIRERLGESVRSWLAGAEGMQGKRE